MRESDYLERADLELVRSLELQRTKRFEKVVYTVAAMAGAAGFLLGINIDKPDQPEDLSEDVSALTNQVYYLEGQLDNLCENDETIDHHIQNPGVTLPLELPQDRPDEFPPGSVPVTNSASNNSMPASPITSTTTTIPGSRDPNVIRC